MTWEIGLNRNILECKFKAVIEKNVEAFGLNRNILECKFLILIFYRNKKIVLIETYWNVNERACGG